ncbi:MAG: transporter substrate-binding domain-containing protein [Clostridia bacterium]
MQKIKCKLVIQPISWNAKEQELNSGNIDCIWNGMSITEERKQAMLLSDSYMKNRMVFITKQDSNLKTLEDLKNKKVGVQSGSSAEQKLEESETYKTLNQTVAYADNITALWIWKQIKLMQYL